METEAESASSERSAVVSGWWKVLLGAAAFALVTDQLTKSWAVANLDADRSRRLLGFLELRLAYNQGMSFSLADGHGVLIGLVALTIVGSLCWFARTTPSMWIRLTMGLVIGGAVGNLVDRVLRETKVGQAGFLKGAVVDFLYTGWWPTFNVADAAIVGGGIAMAVLVLISDVRSARAKSTTQ